MNNKNLRSALFLIVFAFTLSASCGSDSETEETKENEGCNNSAGYVNCPDGYQGVSTEGEEEPQCTVGEGNCISVLGGSCSEAGTCDCSTCFLDSEIEVAECAGLASCRTIKSCETEINCVDCTSECTRDENRVPTCDPAADSCRELNCAEDPTLKYFCELR